MRMEGGTGRVARRWAVWVLGSAMALTAGAQDGARPKTGQSWIAEVTYVVDGDSIWVRSEDGGKRRKLRLDGIDAPEICQTHGPEARAAMRELAQDQLVRITVRAYDRYGRGIATVRRMADDVDIASALATQGWAWSESFRGRQGKYWREEAQARKGAMGLFSRRQPETPAEFRKRHGPCGAKAYS
ncbi:thermonuclease family protein [Ottowia sp. VDI28]|uniref:thermonuclease family protein n=1 Tax=Ottowia sp. VDI28 TaxID=3133968 RepID=UPI003C2D1488